MVSFTSWPIYPRETALGTQWIGWVGPRADLGDMEVKGKINYVSLVAVPSLVRTTYRSSFFLPLLHIQ
jgi:hypothetical protein